MLHIMYCRNFLCGFLFCVFCALLPAAENSLRTPSSALSPGSGSSPERAGDNGMRKSEKEPEDNSLSQPVAKEKEQIILHPGSYSQSPRKAVEDFVDLMFAGTSKKGDSSALVKAICYLQYPQDMPPSKRQSYLRGKADDLFVLLKTLSYTNDQLPAAAPEGAERIVFELGDESLNIKFTMIKEQERGWVFARSNFQDPQIMEAIDVARKRTSIPSGNNDFSLDLCSPLRAMYTFIYGVQSVNGYDLDDAVRSMDLQDVDAQVVQRLGKTWAVQLYRILQFASPVLRESLPNDPLYEGEVVLLVNPDYGMITLKLQTEPDSGKKAWKINFNNVAFIGNVYDSLMGHGMARQLESLGGKYLPPHVRFDDFFQKRAPAFESLVFGMNVWKWLVIILMLFSSLLLLPLVKIISIPLIKRLLHISGLDYSDHPETKFIRPLQLSAVAYVWLEGTILITADPGILQFTILALNVVLTFTLAWVIWGLIDCFCLAAEKRFSSNLHILTSLTGHLCKGILLIITMLYISQIFGFNGTKFFTALGIGGLALALAGKDTIENLFGSIMIIADRPFKKGDWVKVNDIEGLVEQVGVRSTRLRTFYDSVITVPNRLFISSSVDNMGMRKYRRYNATYQLAYQTPPEKILAFTKEINEIILRHPLTRKDRFYVRLHDIGDTSLNVLVDVFFAVHDQMEEFAAREELITQSLKAAQKLEVEFAFPARTPSLRDKEQKKS